MGHLIKQPARWGIWLKAVLFLLGLLVAGCNAGPWITSTAYVTGGDPAAGQEAIVDYGCQTCHIIPGIAAPKAYVGPPLDEWPSRSYIAGNLSNTPDNLIQWIRFPQEVEPGTAMPDLDVSEEAARDIAAYLFNLR